MKTFKLSIATPSGHKYENEEVTAFNCNLIEGRIGILAEHTPLISSLKISDFSIETKDGNKITGAINTGVIEVYKNEVTVLTRNFCLSHEVNMESVSNEIKNVKYQLNSELSDKEEVSLKGRLQYEELKLNL